MSDERFTPKTLAEFWAAAPSEDARPELIVSSGKWRASDSGPGTCSYIKGWRWPPQEKVIDLSCLAGSDVLCEFCNSFDEPILFDKLHAIDGMYSQGSDRTRWNFCTPALGLWQACNGRLPGLPEGLDVTVRAFSDVFFHQDKLIEVQLRRYAQYHHPVAYRVNGKLGGYKWPWE